MVLVDMIGEHRQKVLIVHRHFWPQQYPYATMLKDIAEALATHGYQVEVITSCSGASDDIAARRDWSAATRINVDSLLIRSGRGVGIVRKTFDSVIYWFWLIYKLSLRKCDYIWVATTPPVISATLVRLMSSLKQCKYIYHCQDIHPEALVLNGNLKPGIFFRLLASFDKKNIENAWSAIVLSTDMKKTLMQRGVAGGNISVINNFIFESDEVRSSQFDSGVVRFLFAGTMGRFQNLELLMKAVSHFGTRQDVQFNFMGGGALVNRLKEVAAAQSLSNVTFIQQMPVEGAVAEMHRSHFGIVSLSDGIINVAYPSKTMMYLGNGLPVIAFVNEDTELARYLESNQLGFAVGTKSVENMVAGINRAIVAVRANQFDRSHVATTAQRDFGRDQTLKKYLELFN